MKRLLYTFLIIVFSKLSFAQQGINNNWLMGYDNLNGQAAHPKFDFYNGTPIITLDSLDMRMRHTHANISDTQGNLLFYTNGYYIANANNDTMQNGSGINPSAYTTYFDDGLGIPQSHVIIPKPGSNTIYYMFHSTADTLPGYTHSKHLYLSEIDMSLNGGLGAVTVKNQILCTDSMNFGKIAMCRTANGRDWWLMVSAIGSNKFIKFLITVNGVILGPYYQNIGVIRVAGAGEAWFSPDGKRFAQYWKNIPSVPVSVELFDFNRCTGMLSNAVSLPMGYENSTQVGLAFSPNSNVLYVSNVFHVYQYDLTAANIAASQQMVATYDSFLSVNPNCSTCTPLQTLFCLSALAPDGKIYISTGNSTVHWHTIDNPDSLGIGCNVNQHSVQVPAYYFNTIPNHPNYFLGCDTTLGCTTCFTGLSDNTASGAISARAAPNPTTGVFTLQFDVQPVSGELEIYDVMGNLVLKDYIAQWSQFKRADITQLADGIYFCKLKWRNVGGNVKVIKE
ncbi:MAG: T9SS type A sorting domain-containing protein [Bacteroidetes bacterium]|nr:T9SS type A sorting domain-containing protein [Bacteroidota bacterium]